jgi:hypothetical protein
LDRAEGRGGRRPSRRGWRGRAGRFGAGDAADPDEEPGTPGEASYGEKLQEQLPATQPRLQKLTKLGARQLSVTDPDSRFRRESGGGFTLGYPVDVVVSDNASLLPLVEQVEQTCGARPEQVSADSGFFSVKNLNELEKREIEGYVPDAHFSGAQQGRRGPLKTVPDAPAHRRMRARLRSPAGRARYRRRQALVEPVIGILKEQRGM